MSTSRSPISVTESAEAVALRAPVVEVFASIQGEGLFAGQPQVLLRLSGCPLRCRWCDTPGSWTVPEEGEARIYAESRTRTAPAWASPFRAATWISEVDPQGHRPVSVTGGEPLLWPAFLRELATLTGSRRRHLETSGSDPDALEEVLDVVDHVSLDLKLPADLDPPAAVEEAPGSRPAPASEREWAEVRARNLVAVRDRDACGKLVVRGGIDPDAYLPILDDVADLNRGLLLVLQPVTPVRGAPAPDRALLDALVALALERELDVRVVPQIHRGLGLP